MLDSHTRRQLRGQVHELRSAIGQDAEDLRQWMIDTVDYRKQVRRHPWACSAAAFTLGLLAAPAGKPAGKVTDGENSAARNSKRRGLHLQEVAADVGRTMIQSLVLALGQQTFSTTESESSQNSEPDGEWSQLDAAMKAEAIGESTAGTPSNGAHADVPPATATATHTFAANAIDELGKTIARYPNLSLLAAGSAGICLGCLLKRSR